MKRAYLELHTAVFLFGFTAILGRLISIDAIPLVWWRVLITSVSFLFILNLRKTFREIPRTRMLQYLGIGVLLAGHWITFFWSIKLANASVALAAFSTQAFFTAFLEPMIVRSPFRKYELLLGLLIIPAMLLIVNGIDVSMTTGLALGIFSAVLIAFFTSMNKRLINTATPLQISFFELSGALLSITVVLPWIYGGDPGELLPKGNDIFYLLILALVCTTIAYVLAMRALRHLSAFASTLTVNLEPIYGIVLAWLLLNENEELGAGFYLGSAVMIASVFCYPILRRRLENNNRQA